MRTKAYPEHLYIRAAEGTRAEARKLAKRLKCTPTEAMRQALYMGMSALRLKIRAK